MSLDSERISLNDFVPFGTIYNKSLNTKLDQYFPFLYAFFFLALIVSIYFGLKIYKRKTIEGYIKKIKKNLDLSSNQLLAFSNQEILLLKILTENSKNQKSTTIEQINKIIGLESRPIETQKSQRHKLISSINAKYRSALNRKLIHSEKLEFDRRSNVFYIEKEDVEIISTHLH